MPPVMSWLGGLTPTRTRSYGDTAGDPRAGPVAIAVDGYEVDGYELAGDAVEGYAGEMPFAAGC